MRECSFNNTDIFSLKPTSDSTIQEFPQSTLPWMMPQQPSIFCCSFLGQWIFPLPLICFPLTSVWLSDSQVETVKKKFGVPHCQHSSASKLLEQVPSGQQISRSHQENLMQTSWGYSYFLLPFWENPRDCFHYQRNSKWPCLCQA